MVNPLAQAHRGLGTTLFSLLNPIPFGFFVGALIFDAIGPGGSVISVNGVANTPEGTPVQLAFSPVTVTVR